MERCLACEAVVSKATRCNDPRLSALYGSIEVRIVNNVAEAGIAILSPGLPDYRAQQTLGRRSRYLLAHHGLASEAALHNLPFVTVRLNSSRSRCVFAAIYLPALFFASFASSAFAEPTARQVFTAISLLYFLGAGGRERIS